MRSRTFPWLAGLAAVGVLAVACEDGSDIATERGADTPTVRASTPAAGAGDRAKEGSSASLSVAEFSVDGMTCGGCALATEIAVRKVDGVASVDAAYHEATGEGRCTVQYDPAAVGPSRIARAIREAGFEPTLRERAGG